MPLQEIWTDGQRDRRMNRGILIYHPKTLFAGGIGRSEQQGCAKTVYTLKK